MDVRVVLSRKLSTKELMLLNCGVVEDSCGEGNGNPLQYSCLENPMDRGAWQAAVHGGHKRVRHDLTTKPQQQQNGKAHKSG